MSKDLYYTILKFFEDRLQSHTNVLSWDKIENNDFYLYKIRRKKQGDAIKVWLSDAYRFTDFDYHNRPVELRPGDYILIAKPEGGGGPDQQLIDEAKIGIGKLAEFMGALNSDKMWKYVPPTDEEKEARRNGRKK